MHDDAPATSLRRDQLAIGLVAAMLVALEVVWTRIFSAEFFYSFAFLTVSLAVLGLGLGALSLRFWPALATSSRIGLAALIAAGTAALAPALVLRLDIDFVALWRSWGDIALLLLGVGVLVLPYLAGGVFIAALLRRHRVQTGRLYAADLVPEIADDVVNVDRAMKWGYAWNWGPFELLDEVGPANVIAKLEAEGHALPKMLQVLKEASADSFYRGGGQEYFGLDGQYHATPEE